MRSYLEQALEQVLEEVGTTVVDPFPYLRTAEMGWSINPSYLGLENSDEVVCAFEPQGVEVGFGIGSTNDLEALGGDRSLVKLKQDLDDRTGMLNDLNDHVVLGDELCSFLPIAWKDHALVYLLNHLYSSPLMPIVVWEDASRGSALTDIVVKGTEADLGIVGFSCRFVEYDHGMVEGIPFRMVLDWLGLPYESMDLGKGHFEQRLWH